MLSISTGEQTKETAAVIYISYKNEWVILLKWFYIIKINMENGLYTSFGSYSVPGNSGHIKKAVPTVKRRLYAGAFLKPPEDV